MTDDHSRIAENESHRRLTDRYDRLAADLAAGWDLEAGLADALLPTRHAALVERLRDAFDLDAGLAAILPTRHPTTPATTTREPRPAPASEPAATSAVAQMLNTRPAAVRLALRSHPAVVATALCLQVHRARLTIEIISRALTRNHARDLDRALTRNRDLADNLALDLTLARNHAIDLDLAHSLTWTVPDVVDTR